MLPEATYRAMAQPGAHLSETKNGKPFVAVTFRVTKGEMAGETIDWQGWLSTEKAETRTMASLRYCGWKGDSLDDIGELDQEVEIVVEHEVGNDGKTRAKVAWVNGPRPGMAVDKAKALADRLRAKAKAVPLVDGSPPGGDDNPFGE
jgi:hypothetical protein